MAKLKLLFSEEINHKEMDGRRQISEHWNVQSKDFLIGNFVDSNEMQRQKIPASRWRFLYSCELLLAVSYKIIHLIL